MNDAEETLRWHEWWRNKWTESRPAPAEMTDSEMLDFIDEYVDLIQVIPATKVSGRRYVIDIYGMDKVRAGSLREAVALAMANYEEANRDY